MKRKTQIIVLAFILISTLASAQSFTFKVLVSKGKTEIKSGTDWSGIKVGASLQSSDEVKVAPNSYLGLIHSNGKPLELKEAGNYKVSDLVGRMGGGQSVINKYTDFILSSEQEKKNKLTATGAVHRAPKDPVTLYLPQATHADVYDSEVMLNWSAPGNAGPFEVVFMNLSEDVLAKFETKEDHLLVDLNEGKLVEAASAIVKIVSKTKPAKESSQLIIKRVTGERKAALEKAAAESGVNLNPESALESYLLGSFYEEQLMIIDAIREYYNAYQAEPEIAIYEETYKSFLQRLGFKVK